ncbi:MAG: YCF48-related protein [Chloroflexota bacterium]
MSKQKERIQRKRQQKTQSRWLIAAGFILVLVTGLWLAFSNTQSNHNGVRPISRLTTDDFHSLAFSPTEPETIFFGHHHGLLVSHNGGKDWQSTPLTDVDAMVLALPLSDADIMYAAGHDVFFKSTDGGKTWKSVTTNLPGLDIHGFTIDPENANRVYAHVVGYGIFGSQDGGNSWTLLSASAPPSTFNLTIGKDVQTLYSAARQAGLWKSIDGGQTWAMSQTPDEGAIAVTYIRANNRLFVTTLGPAAGLYYSDDGGKNWRSAGLNGTLLAVAVSPLDLNHVIVVNDQGEVFASRDGGISWSDK